eukprot:CAMPEP_0197651878 /NCGR_PEP_ID=MMETSP1338-20131121/34105_1 /TAXON_ID=43686 ORGANISM="Pelagodinium beii, Strain RCC1491" /NCGR_SAMPLE_ID=MMETSP1338 /ASSEMBLY_ACC=CAM_ASM_000754 /LENGTH=424 /DNA_ID=CAMNT_0043226633 /DNA_START=152 /DNA_END=1426 /DNA_ORIENTATION=+
MAAEARKVLLILGALTLACAVDPVSHRKSHVLKHGTSERLTSAVRRQESQKKAANKNMLQDRYPFYHTTSQIRDEARDLVNSCNGRASMWSVNESDVGMDVIRVNSSKPDPPNRVFIMFGEHSRELISPESGLALLKMLCGADDSQHDLVRETLQESEFAMILNANPRSRLEVEEGNYCKRTNPSGVDLNRNWDEDWSKESANFGADSFPGPQPFSEPETRLMKSVVAAYQPTTYLTVHSGTLGMYMPWAYDMEHLASRNQKPMMEILQQLDVDHCQCPFGAAGKEVGYNCPGTSLDWIYDKLNISYAFAFEIWVDSALQADLKDRWKQQHSHNGSQLEQGQSLLQLADKRFSSLFQAHESDFVHLSTKEGSDTHRWNCFKQYNPNTEADYNSAVSNWAKAYLHMAQKVVERMKDSGASATEVK